MHSPWIHIGIADVRRQYSSLVWCACRLYSRWTLAGHSSISKWNGVWEHIMRYELRSLCVGVVAVIVTVASGTAIADADLDQKQSNPENWAMQAGDYANHRWSDLKQINAGNVGELQVAWTLSTGVLRGHEGSPLVIGDTMYIHTPFPNNVYAVNLKDQTFKWKYEPKQDANVIPVMCCDTVSRGLAYGDG